MHYLSDIYSIGNHLWDKRANSKMLQSQVAVELGMNIAPTCISNIKKDITTFANRYRDISLKSLRSHNVRTEDERVYHLHTIRTCPEQLEVQPEESFAQTETTGAVDWRDGYDYGLKHEIIETPQVIDTFCRQYLQKFHLNFGCFDFIVTPEDSYVFLECNPNGQWGWIEDLCDVPMSEAIVDCLVNKLSVSDAHA